jgi:hypothetical protein
LSFSGAETPVYLALLPADFKGARGALWGEKRVIDFERGTMLGEMLPTFKKLIADKFKSKKEKNNS